MNFIYKLQNRYQDSGWEDLDLVFYSRVEAIEKAVELSRNSICYGMVRVVCRGRVIETFVAGGSGERAIE